MRNIVLMLGLFLALSGCTDPNRQSPTDASQPPIQGDLKAGYQSLEQKQYDQAMAQADAYLRNTPRGEGSAEALYLKGRALEDRVAGGQSANPDADWQAARVAYINALQENPAANLAANIHAGIANVAYFQDDYATALAQWSQAYDALKDPGVKSWVLYRIGLCQQRLGRFDNADRTFADVQKEYSGTLPAQRSAEHCGARAFYVQLATYANPAGADRAIADARALGIAAQRMPDAKGRTVVRAGPFATFPDAKVAKSRAAAKFPDALIVP